MRILLIGDIIGKPGRSAVQRLLPGLRREYRLDLVVANGENSAAGFGITEETAQDLLDGGVDVITSGGHIWDRKEVIPHLDGPLPILRPLNYPPGVPGNGHKQIGDVLVVNVMGRVFVKELDCPFRAMDSLLDQFGQPPPVVVVDFHAEATSEKEALGWYLDGRVSVVVGTHTHVPTADARILPKGTAYVTDLGKVGPINSIIGNTPEDVLERFLYQTPNRLGVPGGPVSFNSVLVEVDQESGRATGIQRVDRTVEADG
ncbi:MAG: TIGR00282 family metallophosphoesterase [Chloroflexi bacterium]|nr:TIGR00282 family metallophosphoesterase [Chloroflexota bacterium]